VKVPGIPAPFEVWLWEDDWACSCDQAGPCGHVVAAAVAVAEGAVAAGIAPSVRYAFRRQGGRLVLDRDAPSSAVRRAEDHELNRVFAGWWGREDPPKGLLQQALDPLRGAAVTLDSQPIRTDPTPVLPVLRLEDHGAGWRARLVRQAGIDEVFGNGVVRIGEVLRPIGVAPLDEGLRVRLIQGMEFTAAQAGFLASDFLPKLRALLPVDLHTTRLPQVAADPPRLELNVRADGDVLAVQALIVYGDPPVARVEHGELVLLGRGAVPVRDLAGERRLLAAGMPVGAPLERVGAEAARWAARLPGALRDEVLARAPRFRLVKGEVAPEVQVTERDGRLSLAVRAGGADPQALVDAWRAGESLVPLLEGGFRPLPRAWMERHGHVLAELLGAAPAGRLERSAAPMVLDALEQLGVAPPPGLAGLRALAGEFDAIPAATLPLGLTAELRPYQRRGADWLAWLRSVGMGGILADDMGLGKTVQCLAAIEAPALVVCPTSVLANWAAEAGRFRPDLSVATYHGPERQLPRGGLTLTTYAILRLDREILTGCAWRTVVLDEAQAIKNPESQTAAAARALTAEQRLCLTGTPVENRLEELWSALTFCNPGLLGSRRAFQDRFAGPIEAGRREPREALRRRIRPFVLRRLKRDVAAELPPRTEVVRRCTLTAEERELYQSVRTLSRRDAAEMLGGGRTLQVLEVLLRMRQASCHAGLLPGKEAPSSSKVELLVELLEEVVAEGHRALVFSQWTSLLDLVEPHLRASGWSFCRLDGATRDRAGVVARFQAPDGPPVFLLSLKAGGSGLNLTAADYVFLLDPWWNPAVEDQATDRAHRIGQARPVVSVRLVAEDTVEERILSLQARKRDLAAAALDDAAVAAALGREDILALFDA
jgi:superfamily II DNA or RNA helicase